MAHMTWTCTVCSLLMTVEDGLAHIGSDGHKARLAQFNANALVSRVKELTLFHSLCSKESITILPVAFIRDQQWGITGYAHARAETFTHSEFSRYLTSPVPWNFRRTVEPTEIKAKLCDAVTISAQPSAVLWTCTICNREMQGISKDDHLAGKAHARKLIHKPSTILAPLHVNYATSGTSEVNETKEERIAKPESIAHRLLQSWACPSCNVIVPFRQKAAHYCSSSDSKASITDGPLDNFFHLYPSFRYDASTPPAISFGSLQKHLQKRHKWSRESPKCKEIWHRYQMALTQEFNLWFGVEDDLNAWHSLCRAVRVIPLPTTSELCRSVGLPPPILEMREH